MARPSSRHRSDLSNAVIQLRRSLGDTQQQFAMRLGLAMTTIARYETSRQPQGDVLLQFARVAEDNGYSKLAQIFRRAMAEEAGFEVPSIQGRKIFEAQPGEEQIFGAVESILRQGPHQQLRDELLTLLTPVIEENRAKDFLLAGAALSQQLPYHLLSLRWSFLLFHNDYQEKT